MVAMVAEQLIAFEAALSDLGYLCLVARTFSALRPAADADLAPRVRAIGARLRTALRQGTLDEATVAAVAGEIAGLRTHWEAALEAFHVGAAYRRALTAWQADRVDELAGLLPNLVADLVPVRVPPPLYVGISVSTGRRRPGMRPFLTAEACADRIAAYRTEGFPADVSGTAWWDTELACLRLVDDPDALETPVALRIEVASVPVPVFAGAADDRFRIYARVLKAPFSATLRDAAGDEWWEASAESYPEFRAALAAALYDRGVAVDVWRVDG